MHYMKKAEKHTLTNSKMTSCKYTNDMDVKAAFLLDEAVDKWAEDNDENHTAAEDHHLFLKDRREQEAEAQSRCHVFNWAICGCDYYNFWANNYLSASFCVC